MTAKEKLPLLFVWLALMAGSVPFILRYWSEAGDLERGSIAAGLFVAIMTALCAVGGLAYASQRADANGGPDPPSDIRYAAALKTSLIWQFVTLSLSALILDMGQARHIAVVAIAAYWPMVLLIALRRPNAPTMSDLLAIRYGYLFVWMAVATAGPLIWKRMGHW